MQINPLYSKACGHYLWGLAVRFLLSLLVLATFNVSAEIYKCEVNGKLSFSDAPCGDSAEVIQVEAPQKTGSKLTTDSMDQLSGELHKDRKQRETDKAIERQQKHIENLADKYHKTLNDLEEKLVKVKSDYYYRNGGANSGKQKMLYEKKRRLQNKISDTKRRYKTDKQQAYNKLYRLKQERKKYR